MRLRVSNPETNSSFVKVMNAKSVNFSDVATILKLFISVFLKRSRRQNSNVNLFDIEFLQFNRQRLLPYLWRVHFQRQNLPLLGCEPRNYKFDRVEGRKVGSIGCTLKFEV